MFPKRQPKPIPYRGPTEQELAKAREHFQLEEPLCVAEGIKTNDGFGASISFNASTFRSKDGEGSVQLALRDATLEFRAGPMTTGLSWSEAVAELLRTARRVITVKLTGSNRDTANRRSSNETSGKIDAKLAPAGFGFGAQLGGSTTAHADAGREQTQTTDLTSQEEISPIEIMQRSGHRFELCFSAPGAGDLVRFNPDLSRFSVLSAPEPSSFDHNDVSVVLKLGLADEGSEISHAFRIRRASGAWSGLAASRNKQIIGELVVSKFLEPMHNDQQLWPPVETAQ